MERKTVLICLIVLVTGFLVLKAQTVIRQDVSTVAGKNNLPVQIRNEIVPEKSVVLKTIEIKDITSTTARCLYEVINPSQEIVQHGVCVGKGQSPTISGTFFIPKNLGPVFSAEMINLSPSLKLYVRAFAKLKSGEVIYGNELSFMTLAPVKK
jgi:hypothetical protein